VTRPRASYIASLSRVICTCIVRAVRRSPTRDFATVPLPSEPRIRVSRAADAIRRRKRLTFCSALVAVVAASYCFRAAPGGRADAVSAVADFSPPRAAAETSAQKHRSKMPRRAQIRSLFRAPTDDLLPSFFSQPPVDGGFRLVSLHVADAYDINHFAFEQLGEGAPDDLRRRSNECRDLLVAK
jgi:hypothetical protein